MIPDCLFAFHAVTDQENRKPNLCWEQFLQQFFASRVRSLSLYILHDHFAPACSLEGQQSGFVKYRDAGQSVAGIPFPVTAQHRVSICQAEIRLMTMSVPDSHAQTVTLLPQCRQSVVILWGTI